MADDVIKLLRDAPLGQEAVHEWFKKVISDYGFSLFVLIRLSGREFEDCRVHGNYPQPYMDRWTEQAYTDVDPVWLTANSAMEPFAWSSLPEWTPTRKSSKRQRQFADDVRSFGFKDGLTIPTTRLRGAISRVNLSGFKGSEAEFLQNVEHALPAIWAAAKLLDVATLDLPISWGNRYRLTPRQTECLYWTSNGKTAAETAEILQLSKRTVEGYLEEAKRILGALTIPQAVAKAMSAGLLRP